MSYDCYRLILNYLCQDHTLQHIRRICETSDRHPGPVSYPLTFHLLHARLASFYFQPVWDELERVLSGDRLTFHFTLQESPRRKILIAETRQPSSQAGFSNLFTREECLSDFFCARNAGYRRMRNTELAHLLKQLPNNRQMSPPTFSSVRRPSEGILRSLKERTE